MVKKVNTNEFKDAVKDYALVDFYADWCGPCRMISPIVEELSNEMQGVEFIKVDVDSEPELATLFGIRSIPTLMLFKNGQKVDQIIGFVTKQKLEKFIEKHK